VARTQVEFNISSQNSDFNVISKLDGDFREAADRMVGEAVPYLVYSLLNKLKALFEGPGSIKPNLSLMSMELQNQNIQHLVIENETFSDASFDVTTKNGWSGRFKSAFEPVSYGTGAVFFFSYDLCCQLKFTLTGKTNKPLTFWMGLYAPDSLLRYNRVHCDITAPSWDKITGGEKDSDAAGDGNVYIQVVVSHSKPTVFWAKFAFSRYDLHIPKQLTTPRTD